MKEEIKNHIESWKKQCGYDTPFDYVGLNNIIDKQLSKGDYKSKAYRMQLIKKCDNMVLFAKDNFNEGYYEGVLNAMRNMKVHVDVLYRKHYNKHN